jgi:AmiR/NasT family two-component response regulator
VGGSSASPPGGLSEYDFGMAMPDPIEVESLEDARTLVGRLLSVTEATAKRRAQLEQALETRIVIEQAKGVLAERFSLEIDEAFVLLRHAARSSQRKLRDLAAEVAASRGTPPEVERAREAAL